MKKIREVLFGLYVLFTGEIVVCHPQPTAMLPDSSPLRPIVVCDKDVTVGLRRFHYIETAS
jgi:hypothetical protein